MVVQSKYRKIPVQSNNPWANICSKGCFAGLISGEAYFRRGLLLEGILRFKMGWACNKNSLKQLALTAHGLILGRAYYRKDICV